MKMPIFIYPLIILGILVFIIWLKLFIEYRKHKAPLKAVDPSVDYNFSHHLRMVTIPTLKYRLNVKAGSNK